MGFTKWLLKNGVGSIGNTTKTWTKIYLDTIKDLGHGGKKEASYIHVIMSYTLANQKVREFYSTDPTLLLDKSDGCLAMLMWTLICEIPSNINAILSDAKHFDNSSDVIYQCVMELAPHEILMTPSQYRVMALEYLNYRDNVARALKSNNNIVETKYRTAVINRLDRQTEVYNNQFFNDAKDRFLSLTMDYTAEEYSIWTIEMNSNKYVYVHFSNDNSLKLNLNISAKQLSGKIRFPGIDYQPPTNKKRNINRLTKINNNKRTKTHEFFKNRNYKYYVKMENKERYIFDSLMTLSSFKGFEFINQNGIINLTSSSNKFNNSKAIKITIAKPFSGNKENVNITAKVNEITVSDELKKEFLYAVLREINILSKEQFIQIIILLNNEIGKISDFSDFALHAFYDQINNTWPELKNDIHLQILGDRNQELIFIVKKGLADKVFQSFFNNGIKLKAAIKNCKNFKIEKLVFFDEPKNEYLDFKIEELEKMDLK